MSQTPLDWHLTAALARRETTPLCVMSVCASIVWENGALGLQDGFVLDGLLCKDGYGT
jgi:hypothetical protein